MRHHVVAGFLLAASLHAQRTWVVDAANGAGTDFTDIPPAVAAAQPGDRIVVRGSTFYSSFTLDKGLDIEALQGAAVSWFVVQGVPLPQVARVAGFVVRPVSAGIFQPLLEGWVRVAQCAGTVVLAGLRVGTGLSSAFLPPYTYISAGIEVQNSRAVLIVDTQVGADTSTESWGLNGAGLVVTGAQVVVQRSSIRGAPGRYSRGTLNSAYPGTHGIWSVGGVVVCAAVTAAGGTGGAQAINCFSGPEHGGNGVEGDGILLLGGSVLVAGPGGAPCSSGTPGPPGLAASGTHRVTADCTVNGALGPGVQTIPPLPWLGSPGVCVLGQPTSLAVHAQSGAVVALFLDPAFGFLPIPGLDGPFLLTPALWFMQAIAVPPPGVVNHTFTLPADPVWRDRMLYFQGAALQPGVPTLALTNLGDLRLR